MLIAPEGDPDAPDIPTLRSYAEAIEGPYSSQWQAAMDAEMASWKSTGTFVDEVPPPGANIVSGMLIFRVKRPPGSPPAFKARYVARGFSQRQGVDFFQTFSPTPKMTTLWVLLHVATQRDYELHSLDFSTAFLQGSLHEEIWLRRPPSFTGRTLAALGFAPSTSDPSLFLRIGTTLPPFYVLMYVDDLVFAADTEALTHITRDRAQRTITLTQSHMVQQVLQRFSFTYSLPQSTPLPTSHSLSSPPSDESVEPSGPYPKLVGCLVYLMTCTRPDLAYPLSLLARYVAPGRHRKVHWDDAKRVLRYLCSTLGMGLVLGGRARVVLTGHGDASWVDDLATQRSSQGYTFSLSSGSVSWRSSRSSSVFSSSCEARVGVLTSTFVFFSPFWRFSVLASILTSTSGHCWRRIGSAVGSSAVALVTPVALGQEVPARACFAFLDWSCDLLFSPILPMGVAAEQPPSTGSVILRGVEPLDDLFDQVRSSKACSTATSVDHPGRIRPSTSLVGSFAEVPRRSTNFVDLLA
ncbi:unnamed protein product [Closterium sp. NIES-53]